MPDHGVGIFVFTNRTYNGGAGPAWDAAMALQKAGALVERMLAVSPLLADGYAAAGRMYAAGDVGVARDRLAMNFLMDNELDSWRDMLTALKEQVGACRTDAPIKASGNLSGSFTWACDKGRVAGSILLAPTQGAQIQELKLAVKTP
jgi:hypothetical protein